MLINYFRLIFSTFSKWILGVELAFIGSVATATSWLILISVPAWIKMKVTSDRLLLFLTFSAWYDKPEGSHIEDYVGTKRSLDNVNSTIGTCRITIEWMEREKLMLACGIRNSAPINSKANFQKKASQLLNNITSELFDWNYEVEWFLLQLFRQAVLRKQSFHSSSFPHQWLIGDYFQWSLIRLHWLNANNDIEMSVNPARI